MQPEKKTDVLVVGAGAAGLAAARELGKAGKKVIILEARDRIGGRIWPLPETIFGYEAEAGAEYVHGDAPLTKALAQEAGMTLILTQGDMWNSYNGELTLNNERIPNQDILHKKLKELKQDLSIAEFFEKYIPEEKYAAMRGAILGMTEGYDAADPARVSTFALRDDWLGGGEWLQYRIKEGYGTLLKFLESECGKNGVEIRLNSPVEEINVEKEGVSARSREGNIYEAERVIVTVPLPVLKDINFIPAIPEKLEAVQKIGFGGVIKSFFKFKNRWWANISGKDFGKMDFMLSNEVISVWWTQYPNLIPVLTGWLAGPRAQKFAKSSEEEIIDAGLASLANIFKVEKEYVKKELIRAKVANWPADPWAKGAYSYWTLGADAAQKELLRPVNNKLFFAGEALCESGESATVEGALASGLETAKKILNL